MNPTPQAHEELYRLLGHKESNTKIQKAELMAMHSLLEPGQWMKELLEAMPDGSDPLAHGELWKEILIASICHVYAALRNVEDGEDLAIPYAPAIWVLVKEKALLSMGCADGTVIIWLQDDGDEGATEPLVEIRKPIFQQVTDPFDKERVTFGIKVTAGKV